MVLWARSRRVLVQATVLAAALVVGTFLGERTGVMPTLFGSGAHRVLLTAFLPLAWAAAVADGFATRGQAIEARARPMANVSTSRRAVLDAGLFIGAAVLAAFSFATFVVVTGPPLSGVGPVLVLSGVACIATLLGGPADGVLAASVLVIVTTVYGITAPASSYVRILQADGDLTWSITCGVALCGAATVLLLTDKATVRLGGSEGVN
jgi:hypothetical protein